MMMLVKLVMYCFNVAAADVNVVVVVVDDDDDDDDDDDQACCHKYCTFQIKAN